MEMEKSYYVVTVKPAYLEIANMRASGGSDHLPSDGEDAERMVVAITQGGFGQDIVDDDRQTKERFLEYLFEARGIDLPRSEEAFDQYFHIERAGEFVDLDEEI